MIYFILNQVHLIYYHIVILILLDVNLIVKVLVIFVTFWDIHYYHGSVKNKILYYYQQLKQNILLLVLHVIRFYI